MTLLVVIAESLTSLGKNKLQTLLSVLGIVIGVASVITVVAVGQGTKAKVEEEIASLGADGLAAEAEAKVAEADVARLKALLEHTSIIAPFDGVVTARNIDTGAFVRSAAQAAGASLFTVKRIDRLRLVVDVPEIEAVLIRVGMPISVEVQSTSEPLQEITVSRAGIPCARTPAPCASRRTSTTRTAA